MMLRSVRAAAGAGLVAGPAHAGDRVDRLDHPELAALLADQPAAHAESLAHLPARYGALPVGHPAAHAALGRELSAGGAPALARRGEDPVARWAASMRPTRWARSSARSIVSLVLVPWIGTQRFAARPGLVPPWPAGFWCWCRTCARSVPRACLPRSRPRVVLAAWLSANLSAVPGELIAYGRRMAINAGKSEVLYTIEGRNSSVAITRWNDGATEIDVNGHVEATTEPYDMKLQRMVGHLPAILHPNGEIGARHRLRRRVSAPARSRATPASSTSRSAKSSR